MQGRIQKWVDHSISVTINLPADVSEELVDSLYVEAWKCGCKAVRFIVTVHVPVYCWQPKEEKTIATVWTAGDRFNTSAVNWKPMWLSSRIIVRSGSLSSVAERSSV